MTKKAYGENSSTQARNIEKVSQRNAYDQMEKEPSEHAKKFFKMEVYQRIRGKEDNK